MNDAPGKGEDFDLPAFWRTLQDLEDGSIQPEQREKLMARIHHSAEARTAYFEYFQQTAIFAMEGAKMDEAGRLPLLAAAGTSRRLFRRSLAVAAVVTAILALVAALIVIKKPEPGILQAQMAAETRWTIDGILQEPGEQSSQVLEGARVRVLSGTLELVMDSGTVLVMQGPATVAFQDLRKPVLENGWLWVDSSTDEDDFAVETKDYLVEDIGTRFGLRARKQGPLEVHLIEGRVKITDKKKSLLVAELTPSESGLALEKTSKPSEMELALDPFPTLPDLLAAKGNLRTTILSQSPVGYWKFDETRAGPLLNEISERRSATHGIAVRPGSSGVESESKLSGISRGNRGIYLNGHDQKSVILGLGTLEGISTREGAVSFWIRGDGHPSRNQSLWLGGRGSRLDLTPTQSVLHTSITTDGRVRFNINLKNEECELSSGRRILDEKWHHIVASWGTTSIDLFVDGRLVDRYSPSSLAVDEKLRGRFVRFGKPGADQRRRGMIPFKGWLDELATFNRPLTHAEVLHQYESAHGNTR